MAESYTELNIHERINAKSWLVGLRLRNFSRPVISLLLIDLPISIRQNVSQPYDNETRLYRKNWQSFK